MWRNLVTVATLLAGAFCWVALLTADEGGPRRGAGTERTGATGVASRPSGDRRREAEPDQSRFAGTWRGEAVDFPEDGSSTDPVTIKLTRSNDGGLEGVALERFAHAGEARLEEIHVTGDRVEFKVRHRTGVNMRVTLGLRNGKLKGEGIPIRSDEDRCHIVLTRAEKGDSSDDKLTAPDLAAAANFDGRWVGAVRDRPNKGDGHHWLIVDVAVDKQQGTLQIITMGDYQESYDEHIDDAKIRNGKLTFQLVDRVGVTATISLWSRAGEKNLLWGEAVPHENAAGARDIELKRADKREYERWGEHRRLVVDPSQRRTGTDRGGRR